MISEGSLHDFSLSDLLQIISLNAETGTLRLLSNDREGVLECRDGQIIAAHAPELSGEEAVYALFHWESGAFRFEAALLGSAANVELPLGDLAKEGIRRLDEWRAIRRELPQLSMRARFRSDRAELPSELSNRAADLWAVLAGTGKTIAELSSETGLDELAVAQTLLELWREGMLSVETAPEELLKILFRRVSEEFYQRFASISGLKMIEGMEGRLNALAAERGCDLRWRSGKLQDGLALGAEGLAQVYRGFLSEQLDYVRRIHGAAFVDRILEGLIDDFTPDERATWAAFDLDSSAKERLS